MRDTYAEYVAWETDLGERMLALAQKEGHCPKHPELGAKPSPRIGGMTASAPTIAIMRALADGEASTADLAEAANITTGSASDRLKCLARTGSVKVVGDAFNKSPMARKTHLWALGPNGRQWLERYGVTHG